MIIKKMNRTNLKYKMYFLVLGSLQAINKGVQNVHAALRYAHEFGDTDEFNDFLDNDETVIFLNGGTSNFDMGENGYYLGTLNQFIEILPDGVNYSVFIEPDINNALTSVCLLADERVYDYSKYPDYDSEEDTSVEQWLLGIGGEKNAILRELLRDKKLAQ
jgi:hypothetical protein